MQQLKAMRGRIQLVLEADPERERRAAANQAEAQLLAARFVLVHRTVPAGGVTLEALLDAKCLYAQPPCTQREVDCGIDCAVYFFLGCAAYPEGAVAFLAPCRLLRHMPASYSPFDTGSLSKFARPRDPLQPWDEGDKSDFLGSHLGDGADAVGFCADYLAAHFEDVADYVRHPQCSEPDFSAYHGLVSTSADRRAWSIEVQLHANLALDAAHLEAIVIGQADLLADIPDELVQTLVVAEDEGSITSTIQQFILQETAS